MQKLLDLESANVTKEKKKADRLQNSPPLESVSKSNISFEQLIDASNVKVNLFHNSGEKI